LSFYYLIHIETHCKKVSYVFFNYFTAFVSNYSGNPVSASPYIQTTMCFNMVPTILPWVTLLDYLITIRMDGPTVIVCPQLD